MTTAAVNWYDGSGQLHIRVYSSDGYTVTERCADGQGWTDGAFKQPGSQVSATAWTASDGAHIRVYCTANDGTTEWCADPDTAWTKGSYTD
ncbi:MAG: hypothetical protein B7Y45_09645 [Sphingomonas sp. 28-66-16]|nr:MAG: hypothetical protein B7Y45_09645 [Sphingomonas sp. 28-66-16]